MAPVLTLQQIAPQASSNDAVVGGAVTGDVRAIAAWGSAGCGSNAAEWVRVFSTPADDWPSLAITPDCGALAPTFRANVPGNPTLQEHWDYALSPGGGVSGPIKEQTSAANLLDPVINPVSGEVIVHNFDGYHPAIEAYSGGVQVRSKSFCSDCVINRHHAIASDGRIAITVTRSGPTSPGGELHVLDSNFAEAFMLATPHKVGVLGASFYSDGDLAVVFDGYDVFSLFGEQFGAPSKATLVITRITPAGSPLWKIPITTNSLDGASLSISADDRLLVGVSYQGEFTFAGHTFPDYGASRFGTPIVLALSGDGSPLFGLEGSDIAGVFRAAPDGRFVVLKDTGPGCSVDLGIFNRNGTKESDRSFKAANCGSDSVYFWGAEFAPDGTLYVAGSFFGTATFLGQTFSSDRNDAFVMRLRP
ncbi:MAG: hypothetical protein ACJ790_11655 [Myxococcaceae bacterium]